MTRIMQDSTNTSAFTAGADLYAGYVLSDTGEGYNNYASMVARFPSAIHVSICTRFNATAQVLDFEAGTTGVTAADAQQAVAWVVQMRQKGITPTIYVQQSLWGWLQGYFISNNVVQPNWWVANTSTGAVMIPGAVAHQYTFNLPNNPYDTSIVADFWPGVDAGDSPSGGGTPIPDPDPEDDLNYGDAVNAATQATNPIYLGVDLSQEAYQASPGGNPLWVAYQTNPTAANLSAYQNGYNAWYAAESALDASRYNIQKLGQELATLQTLVAAIAVKVGVTSS